MNEFNFCSLKELLKNNSRYLLLSVKQTPVLIAFVLEIKIYYQ